MTAAENERALVERYALIPDPQERLGAVVSGKLRVAEIPSAECTPERMVPGCQTPVWIEVALEDGACRFRLACHSPLVRGLAALLVSVVEGTTPEDAATYHPTILADLGIEKNLSPTRVHGTQQIAAMLRKSALALVNGD